MSGPHGLFRVAEASAQALDPLKKRKSPFIAALLGFLCGGIGVGLYLESFSDFLICLVVGILLAVIVPGPGILLGAIGAAVWGALRADASNKKAGYRE